MVKSVLSVRHQGLHDWIIQRTSAIFMAFYIIGLMLYLIIHPDLSYAEWHSLFSTSWMKVGSILFLAALLWHAWLGVWTIFTDYIHSFIVRSLLNFIIILLLLASFLWGVFILWSA